ncbi:MAG: hypothetical protein IKN78_13015 [Bacteroidales bacterium]|nr:hypothetical protein [Bacteroidales bacterium]
MSSSKIQILNDKIRNFLRKYYLDKMYKGIIIFVIILLATFIAFSLFEYFSYSNSVVRSILFYSFILLAVGIAVAYIILPALKISGLGKQLSNEEIAKIIGDHFDQIDDKLLNLFELQKQMERGDYASYDLLSAAIDSKIDSFKAYSFVQAIPVQKTKRFALWMLLPIAIFLLLFSIKKELFTEPTKRIVHYSEVYEKPAPYSFVVTNDSLKAFQYEDYTVNVKVEGSEVPDEVFIKYKNRNYKCQKNANSEFSYTFSNLQQNTEFQINTDEVISKLYEIEVLPKPVLLGFNISLHYPSYLNKPDEVLENVSNLTVPEGTKITWNFITRNSDNLILMVDGHEKVISSEKDNYLVNVTASNSFTYSILNKNKFMTGKDTLTDEVTVIKDMYPDIYVQSQQDSAYHDRVYFKGNIKDDYGFTKLHFVYNKLDKDGKVISSGNVLPVKIQNGVTIQDFYYYFDQGMFDLNPGEQIDYYFQVYDNDGVNGAKSTKSSVQTYRVRTMDEIENDLHQAEEQTKSDYSDLLQESKELAKEIEKMQQKMRQEKEMSWQDKKNLEKLMKDYQKLQEKINELKQQQENHQQVENQYKNVNEDILKKQEELQKRMDEILSDEMKQMMKELEKMMQDMNKDQIQQQMEKMKLSTEDINESLDQQLQLYKQLEVEKKLNEAVQKMRDLADELRKNAEKTENKQNTKESLQKSQQELQKKYDQVKKDIKDMKKLNNELEDPTKFKDNQELQRDADQNMQQSQQNLEKNNRSKSADNQKKAADDIEQMAEQMEQDFNESELESITEDIATIRQIMDNLVKISFDQENILKRAQKMNSMSAAVSDVMKNQFNVKQNMAHIEDSLNALARRQAAVKPFIQKEVTKIQSNIESAQSELQNRRMSNASKNQQFALTSMNNLALMLMESMKDMQEQQKKSESKCNKSGNGSCNKPGGKGKPKKTSARELQQQLNRQMEAMKKSMEQQAKQGQTGKPQQSMSEQFAKMAAQQEAIRKMLQDYQSELKQQNGVGDKALDKLIEDMQKTEKDLVNRQINQQTINRQKDIETRLLQSERADMEREKDKERKSNEARQVPNLNPPKEWKIDREQSQQNEMLRSVPANLNYYYKSKANNYFYNIE